jgi:2-polyprenyl-3-methyl-5-hydroxy-6-metoxy-1,4-benzoquinol methylase
MSGDEVQTAAPVIERLEWDRQYRQGRWDYLREHEETARYRAISERLLARGATSVLDVGCGEGLLLRELDAASFDGRYVGVDWAHAALPAAPKAGRAFICADIERLPVRGRFDAVVLSEVLYYLDDPWTVTAELFSLVAPGGELMISLYHPSAERHPGWHGRISELAQRLTALSGVPPTIVTSTESRRWSLYALSAITRRSTC